MHFDNVLDLLLDARRILRISQSLESIYYFKSKATGLSVDAQHR